MPVCSVIYTIFSNWTCSNLFQCCACYGPKGGRKNYCDRRCTSLKGGTVTKHAYVWFWIRTKMPQRVWKRCMEFKIKTNNGSTETYFVDRRTGAAHKTLTVADKASLKKIPPVPGVLSYRQDNKKVYVNEGPRWDALSSEKEVEKLRARVKVLEQRLQGATATKVLQSCSEGKKKYPNMRSGFYQISPRGNQGKAFEVFCDMASKNGVGVTMVGHDSERRTYVIQNSYRRKITYSGNLNNIAALTKISKQCKQFIKYECFGSIIWLRQSPPYASWFSRQGTRMRYWGGATGHNYKCACGVTNSCYGGRNCNCDYNDSILREDSGYLTDKSVLPVTKLRFGDVGSNEFGFHTLAKLLCWG